MLKSLLLVLISLCFVCGIHGFGSTSPDVIYALENQDIEIECKVDLDQAEGHDSSSLVFNATCTNSSESRFYDSSPPIKIISKDKIKLRVPKSRYSICNYTCQLRQYNVAFTTVFTGRPLGPVKNFKCRSPNWEKMICEFEEMENAIKKLSYKLTYKKDDSSVSHSCNLTGGFNRKRYCEVYKNDDGGFRLVDDLTFTLTTSFPQSQYLDEYPNFTETHKIKQKEVIVPSSNDSKFTASQITVDSALLTWEILGIFNTYNVSLEFDLQMKNQYDKTWIPWPVLKHENNQTLLTNLPYSFADYTVRLRYRTVKSTPGLNNDEDLWSEYVEHTFKTLPQRPSRSPDSPFGAFYIKEYGDYDSLIVYWQQLKESEYNGPNFSYLFYNTTEASKPENSTLQTLYEKNTTKSNNESYKFKVISCNDEGNSLTTTLMHIPRKSDLLKVDIHLTRSYEHNEYKLKWRYDGEDSHLITNYTIFACYAIKSDKLNSCDKDFEFYTVNKDKLSFIFHAARPEFNFAIAANSLNSTTGMQWVQCSSNSPNGIGIPTTAYVLANDATAWSFVVRWHVDCRDTFILSRTQIEYCSLGLARELKNETSIDRRNCTGNMETKNVTRSEHQYNLTGLEPFTMYRILVKLISTDGTSGPAFITYDSTREAAPTEPKNLQTNYTTITNTSIDLTWEPPMSMNGEFKHYEIFYAYAKQNGPCNTEKNEKNTGEFCTNTIITNDTKMSLSDLKSFTAYSDIVVQACTVECSPTSNSITVKTKIGTPSAAKDIRIDKDSEMISWTEPDEFGGNLDFYELKIAKDCEDYSSETFKIPGNHKSCRLSSSKEKLHEESMKICIRAVNLLNPNEMLSNHSPNYTLNCDEYFEEIDGITLPGNWASPSVIHFGNAKFTLEIFIKIAISFVFLCLMFVTCTMVFRKLKKMSDIKPILPDSLQSIIEASSSKYDSEKNLFDADSQQELIPAAEKTIQIVPLPKRSKPRTTSHTYSNLGSDNTIELQNNSQQQHQQQQQPLLVDNSLVVPVMKNSQNQYLPMDAKASNVTELYSIMSTPQIQVTEEVVNEIPEKPRIQNTGYVQISKGISNGYVKDCVQIPQRESFNTFVPVSSVTSNYTPYEPTAAPISSH